MSKWSALIFAICAFIAVFRVAIAQTATTSFEPSPHIYKIVANCPDTSNQRIATGFRVKSQVGIVTALHAVVGCSNLTAQRPSNGPGPFRNLIITKVDIARDVALLWSEDLSKTPIDGFDVITMPKDSDYKQVKVIGYPYDLYRQKLTIDIKIIETTELGNLVFPELNEILTMRGSPDVGVQVLGVQGTLVPGHSGAPLLNGENKIIGVANGGLDLGRTDMTWAIPWHLIEWKVVSSKVGERVSDVDVTHLENLAHLPVELFSGENSNPVAATKPTPTPHGVTATPTPIIETNQVKPLDPDGVESSGQWSATQYLAEMAFDQKEDTAWLSSPVIVKGGWLKVVFRQPKIITRIGLYRSPTEKRGQPKEATLIFEDGSKQKIKFKGFDEWEYIDISPVATSEITFEATVVDPANNYLTIYELAFWGADAVTTNTQSTPGSDQSDVSSLELLRYDGIESSGQWSATEYLADMAFDQKEDTAWLSSPSIVKGGWLKVVFRQPKTVTRVGLYRSLIDKRGQPKEATLTFDNGSKQKIKFKGFDEWEYIDISPVTTSEITFEVTSVDPANNYLTIYELAFYGLEGVSDTQSATNPSDLASFELLQYDGLESSGQWSPYENLAEMAFDQQEDTMWLSSPSIVKGGWLKVVFRQPKTVIRIGLYRSTVGRLGQVKEATLTFDDGSKQKIKFKGFDEWEYIDISPVTTSEITFEVISVDPANNYLTVYELAFYSIK